MIELRQVSIQAGQFSLREVSLTIPSGQYAVLMGRTGSGKTTVLEAVCGMRRVTAGKIFLHNDDVTNLHPADRGVGYVPQDLALFPTLTVREHLAFALSIRGAAPSLINQRVHEMAELLGIGYLLQRRPLGLSGGEAQRVALGRALAFHPQVLLLDEPLSALDEETHGEMIALLRSVQKRTAVTALHITHSRAEANALADCLLQIADGVVSEVRRGSA